MAIPKPSSPPIQLWGIKDALGNITGIIDDAGKIIPMSDIASQGIAVITGERKYGHTLTASPSRGYSFTAGQWTRNGTNIAGATGLTYLQTDADVDQNIFFTPTSPTYSSPAGVSNPDVPGAPTITGVGGDKKLTFTITPSTYTGGASVLESLVDVYDVNLFKVASVSFLGAGTTGTITKNIVNGKTFTLKARQRNRAGWGEKSERSAAITAGGVVDLPGQPAKPVLTAGVGNVSIAWTAGAAGGIPNTGSVWTDINGNTVALTTNPQVVTAVAGTPYSGTVKTQNANGFGPPSVQADAVTPIAAPTDERYYFDVKPGNYTYNANIAYGNRYRTSISIHNRSNSVLQTTVLAMSNNTDLNNPGSYDDLPPGKKNTYTTEKGMAWARIKRFAISTIVVSGNVATVTLAAPVVAPVIVSAGDEIYLEGVTPAGFVKKWVIASVVDASNFTLDVTGLGLTTATVPGTYYPNVVKNMFVEIKEQR